MIFAIALSFCLSQASAWDHHQVILERIVETKAAASRLNLAQTIPVPALQDEIEAIEALAKRIEIDGSKVPHFGQKTASESTLGELLNSNFVDEPDLGMDQNLPNSADPSGFRKSMGGSTGPTSQGFRHMYFAGIDWMRPLATFQLPLDPEGEALHRIELLHKISREYFYVGNFFWGLRTLLWELHYVQDLIQPFHVIQAPSLEMLDWKHLFSGFVAHSTHAIGNYHYAYEGLAYEMVKDADQLDFKKCFEVESRTFSNPTELLLQPRAMASHVGAELYAIFGNGLKSSETNLPEGVGAPDYFALVRAKQLPRLSADEEKSLSVAELEEIRAHERLYVGVSVLRDLTCTLMQSVSAYTLGELVEANMGTPPSPSQPSPQSTSSNTGK